MGFENALVSLLTEPEACREFFDAMTDYKIKAVEKIIDAYKLDVYVNFDDVSNANSMFMSPDTYRETIKPYHAKLVEAVTDKGVIFCQHTCGKCESVLDDYVEIGVKIWNSAQPMNNIPEIQKRYKGQLVVEGGWDTQGTPGYIDASEEIVRAETRRCVEEYGKSGGFILMPVLFNERGNVAFVGDDRLPMVFDEWSRIRSF